MKNPSAFQHPRTVVIYLGETHKWRQVAWHLVDKMMVHDLELEAFCRLPLPPPMGYCRQYSTLCQCLVSREEAVGWIHQTGCWRMLAYGWLDAVFYTDRLVEGVENGGIGVVESVVEAVCIPTC
jgi:hypothetical protein